MSTHFDPRVKVENGIVKGLRVVDTGDHFWFGTEVYAFDEDGRLAATGWFSNEMLNGDHRDSEVFEVPT